MLSLVVDDRCPRASHRMLEDHSVSSRCGLLDTSGRSEIRSLSDMAWICSIRASSTHPSTMFSGQAVMLSWVPGTSGQNGAVAVPPLIRRLRYPALSLRFALARAAVMARPFFLALARRRAPARAALLEPPKDGPPSSRSRGPAPAYIATASSAPRMPSPSSSSMSSAPKAVLPSGTDGSVDSTAERSNALPRLESAKAWMTSVGTFMLVPMSSILSDTAAPRSRVGDTSSTTSIPSSAHSS